MTIYTPTHTCLVFTFPSVNLFTLLPLQYRKCSFIFIFFMGDIEDILGESWTSWKKMPLEFLVELQLTCWRAPSGWFWALPIVCGLVTGTERVALHVPGYSMSCSTVREVLGG